ncbi:MAG: hypothetical protein LBI14_04285 [Treponema sp.]|jgi:hypothetical protein|nr:hypothetical protein [Treponema sp.]
MLRFVICIQLFLLLILTCSIDDKPLIINNARIVADDQAIEVFFDIVNTSQKKVFFILEGVTPYSGIRRTTYFYDADTGYRIQGISENITNFPDIHTLSSFQIHHAEIEYETYRKENFGIVNEICIIIILLPENDYEFSDYIGYIGTIKKYGRKIAVRAKCKIGGAEKADTEIPLCTLKARDVKK